MTIYKTIIKNNKIILALGAESAGNFSVYQNSKIYLSENFGDLLEVNNFNKFKEAVSIFLNENNITPNIILVDLHPLFVTTELGNILGKKYNAEVITVQHHLAHIFSAIGENINTSIPDKVTGIACDGTGYSFDGEIWGGEIFNIDILNKKIDRIGHLEDQILIGADLAIKEPARMLISVLSKFLKKEDIYKYIDKYYTENQFELLYNQLKQNFNCVKSSGTGRVLDAVSVLLGFTNNQRKYKHEPIDLLEKNSTTPYDLEPIINNNVLSTTEIFKYIIENLDKDKTKLAATAQLYIAKGLFEIAKTNNNPIYFSGGMANTKIMSEYLISQGILVNKKVPRGDAGLSFGQIFFYHFIYNSK